MSDEKRSASSDNQGGTRVDLGDDLLQEKTAMLPRGMHGVPQSASEADSIRHSDSIQVEAPTESSSDLIESARILVNEGLMDDAKKALHRVLISDPGNVAASQLLASIQVLELKQILGGEEIRRPFGKNKDAKHLEVDVDVVLQQLDEDLSLGIFEENPALLSAGQLSLFQNPELLDDFCIQLEKKLIGSSVQDWIDMGIGFLEMEFYTIAVRLLSGACRQLNSDSLEAIDLRLSATCLLAFSLILAGRPFEAAASIQPMLYDVEIRNENKVELLYLMGRSYELMKKINLALTYYDQVIAIEPNYRDVNRRIRLRTKTDP
jgi:tetratricopeptide (TPR) repeat protein